MIRRILCFLYLISLFILFAMVFVGGVWGIIWALLQIRGVIKTIIYWIAGISAFILTAAGLVAAGMYLKVGFQNAWKDAGRTARKMRKH